LGRRKLMGWFPGKFQGDHHETMLIFLPLIKKKCQKFVEDMSGNVLILLSSFSSLNRRVLPDNYVETVCGSPFYMAPEVLQFQRYDYKVKILLMFSFGALLSLLQNRIY